MPALRRVLCSSAAAFYYRQTILRLWVEFEVGEPDKLREIYVFPTTGDHAVDGIRNEARARTWFEALAREVKLKLEKVMQNIVATYTIPCAGHECESR